MIIETELEKDKTENLIANNPLFIKIKSASDKAVEGDAYLTPHKEIIQARYPNILF